MPPPMTGVPISVCDVHATLGEGPVWIERDQALWFVDIKQRKVHRFDPEGGSLFSWDAPGQVGWILPADDGGMIAGLQDGLYRFDPAGGGFSLLHAIEADMPGNRLNDAATDPSGRIWFGSMDDGEAAVTGHFYRFDRGMVSDTGIAPVAITNGPALSPDGRLLYHTDTLGQVIHVSEVGGDGTLGPAREFVRFGPGEGYPDGPVVDSEGCVWTGQYAGWEARRYAPDGRLLEIVRFPVSNITKLAFGGPDLRTVFATTAAKGLSETALARQPEAGNLFSFRADVPGFAVTPVAL
jgi:sugar lactone lactonase YvrE